MMITLYPNKKKMFGELSSFLQQNKLHLRFFFSKSKYNFLNHVTKKNNPLNNKKIILERCDKINDFFFPLGKYREKKFYLKITSLHSCHKKVFHNLMKMY